MALNRADAAAVERLRSDATSGASELVPVAIEILRTAAGGPPGRVVEVAREVGAAQPSMASIWHAALASLRGEAEAGSLDVFERRWRRAGAAMARTAADYLVTAGRQPLHVVTCSFSGSVLACLRAVSRRAALAVSCAEGRPACEGRRLAAALAAEGIPAELFTDAGIGEPLWRTKGRADAVIVGADAVSPEWVANKCGTGMLAAAAARVGVPVYVAATRDKFVDARVGRLLRFVEREPAEVWDGAPHGVSVRNLYFERMPIDLVSGVFTDAGTLAADMIAEACRAACAGIDDRWVATLAEQA